MDLSPLYLPTCYGLGSLYFLLLYAAGAPLTIRDVIVFMLSPLTLPLTVLLRGLGGLLDLNFVCFQRRF